MEYLLHLNMMTVKGYLLMLVGCGNYGWNLTTIGLGKAKLHFCFIKWYVMILWRCISMNIDLCARNLLPDWWCQSQPVWLPALTKNEYTIHETWIQRMSKVTGLDGSVEATEHFRYHSVAPTDADHLWGRWWVLPHTYWIMHMRFLKPMTWQTANTWNAWLVDCRGLRFWTQIQGGSDSAVISCGEKLFE